LKKLAANPLLIAQASLSGWGRCAGKSAPPMPRWLAFVAAAGSRWRSRVNVETGVYADASDASTSAMKELRGTATERVPVPIGQCLALVRAVDEYPAWYPDVVRTVDVLERDAGGLPSRARTELRVSVGPLTKDFDLLMAIAFVPPGTVKLVKVGGTAKFNVTWRLDDGDSTRVTLELDANLDAPRFLPLGDIGNSVAQGFVSAASAELTRRG
jgi:hypothetical protein